MRTDPSTDDGTGHHRNLPWFEANGHGLTDPNRRSFENRSSQDNGSDDPGNCTRVDAFP